MKYNHGELTTLMGGELFCKEKLGKKNMKLTEIEEKITEETWPEHFFKLEEDMYMLLDNYRIIIPALELSVREGVCGYMENDEFNPDFSVSVIYEQNETDPEKWLYYENDPVEVSVHNYCTAINIKHPSFDECECIFKIEK